MKQINNIFKLIAAGLAILFFNSTLPLIANASCMGKVPIWGTRDDKASCAQKQKLKKEERDLKIQKKKQELEIEKARIQNNKGTGSGTGNTNVILGGLSDMINGSQREAQQDSGEVIFSQHQARIEWMPYVVPGAYQFDEPTMPDEVLPANSVAWEYFINRNLAVGFLFQRWSKTGGKDFDPIIAHQRDGSGDTAIFFPGALKSLQYTTYNFYAAINAELSDEWRSILRLGGGRTEVKAEYSDINKTVHPYADQPRDATYIDSFSLMAGLAMEYMNKSGTRIGGEIRYHNARYDTSDYREYMNLGSTQILFYIQFMIEPLGLL